ncbi:coiled-coil domain-containing protein [Methanobrevibacter sp.]
MESDEFRTVRVYTKKYTSKDKNGNAVEKESKQKQVSLKKEDPFEDNELVKVLSQEDYEKLLDNQFSDERLDEFYHIIEGKDAEIEELKNQIQTLKGSFFDDVDSLKDEINYKDELLKAKDEIYELNKENKQINDERVAIFKELDYKNKMILAYNVELNKSILNAINVVIDEARDNINRRNALLVKDLEKSIEKSKHDVNEKNKAIAYDIKSTVEDMNEQIRNTSTLKMVLNKKKINLRVPTDDLLKPFDFDFDVQQLLSGQALELDAAEILKEVMPKLPEPFSKYIDTLEEDDETAPETIDVSSKKED